VKPPMCRCPRSSRAPIPAATGRASPAPCLGLALVAGAALWAALGGAAALLSSQLLERGIH
jgi:hypothetical protein